MIGTVWKMIDPDVNQWVYVVLEPFSACVWTLLELNSGEQVRACVTDDPGKMELAGNRTPIHAYVP